MEKLKCDEKGCTKVLEGYSKSHVEHLLRQHKIKHENEKRKKGGQNGNKK